MGYAMRTLRFRYVEWQDRRTRDIVGRELYDHFRDPDEHENIAPRSPKRVMQLSRQLWDALPQPPLFRPTARPKVTFRNDSATPITLYWVQPDGTPREEGVVLPDGAISDSTRFARVTLRDRLGFPASGVLSFLPSHSLREQWFFGKK